MLNSFICYCVIFAPIKCVNIMFLFQVPDEHWCMAGKFYNPGAQGSELSVVETYGKYGTTSCKIIHPCNGKQLKEALQKRLSLKDDSLQLFGVFLGGLDHQVSLFDDDAQIPVGQKLSFTRVPNNTKLETKLIANDEVALHLLFAEAKHAVDTGIIQPSDEQLMQLEDYLDPMFTVERQYLELAQQCEGYGTYIFHNCSINNSTSKVTFKVMPSCLTVDNEIGKISYHSIKSWVLDERSTAHSVSFDVIPPGGTPYSLLVQSSQVSLINKLVGMYCHCLAIELNIIPPKMPERKMGRYIDPLVSFVNSLYKPRLSFDEV